MLSALLYLQYHSFVNRMVRRIRRLKQPKYLFGALVGGLYFYFYFGRFLFGGFGRRSAWSPPSEVVGGSPFPMESVAALLLFGLVLLSWLLPRERAALVFTEAQVAFLVPAPISRRGLLHFQLVRSQLGVLFTSLIMLAVSRRWGGNVWYHALGWWLALSFLSLHSLGSSFARTMLLDRGITNRTRRLVILAAVGLAAAGTYLWARRTIPTLAVADLADRATLQRYAEQVLTAGPVPYLLFPFRLVVKPFFAPTLGAFLGAIGPVLVMLMALYIWVVRSDVAFEEASVEASQKLAAKLTAIRAGNWRASGKPVKPKRPPFKLGSTGVPAVALVWKNIISAGNLFTGRLWFILAIGIVTICMAMAGISQNSGLVAAAGIVSGMAVMWSLMIGPQVLRQDFRQDLALADVLKTYPMPPWQIALGEVLGPVVILTGVHWLLLLVAGGLLSQAHSLGLSAALAASLTIGSALVIPMLNLIVFQIPNAAALLFPAWFAATRVPIGGIEVMGQRIIFAFGQLLVFALTLLPAAGVFAGLFFLGRIWMGPAVIIPFAALGATLVLGVEAAFGIVLLGHLFARFDVAAESAP